MKQPYYDICPACGAHLDPGERCDCQNEKEPSEAATSTEPRPNQTSTVYHIDTIGAMAFTVTELYKQARDALDIDLECMREDVGSTLIAQVNNDPKVKHLLTLAWMMDTIDPVHGLDNALCILRRELSEGQEGGYANAAADHAQAI